MPSRVTFTCARFASKTSRSIKTAPGRKSRPSGGETSVTCGRTASTRKEKTRELRFPAASHASTATLWFPSDQAEVSITAVFAKATGGPPSPASPASQRSESPPSRACPPLSNRALAQTRFRKDSLMSIPATKFRYRVDRVIVLSFEFCRRLTPLSFPKAWRFSSEENVVLSNWTPIELLEKVEVRRVRFQEIGRAHV